MWYGCPVIPVNAKSGAPLFLLQFLQKEKRGYPLLAVHGADDVANTTCALILAQLAVKRKKFYWNLTFFDFSWYMSHGI